MLAAKITNQIQYFKSRVSAGLGLFESESCIEAQLNTINNQNLLDSASLVVTPNAYKTNKLYSVVPFDASGDMDFTRATSATRVNAQGVIETVGLNIPRIDYSDSSCPSILVEPQRTNLLLRSEEFENAFWFKSNVSILSNVTISPNGLMNADKLVENGANNSHIMSVFTGDNGIRTNSIFAKAGERSRFILWAGATGYMFDLLNLTVTPGNNSSSVTNVSIKNYGNDWYRCSISVLAGPNNAFNISVLDNFTNPQQTSPRYQGDGISGIYIWGAQRETASSLTSYIPTTTAAVTRNADVISNSNATNVIGQTEGTIYVDFDRTKILEGLKTVLNMYSNLLTETFLLQTSNNILTSINVQIITGGNTYSRSIALLDLKNKIAVVYSTSGTKIFLNGVQLALFANVGIPAMNRIDVNHRDGARLNGPFRTFALWKSQITDAQAIQLTTL